MINPYSEEERLQAMISACYRASRAHFNHLPLRHIINPPQDMFDAKLARQVAIHLLNVEFVIPRRRLVKTLGIARWTVMQAVRVVDSRRIDPVFERAYERIAERSKEFFQTALFEAADRDAA
ncbi:hypothetical protein [Rhizobium mayense]|uniref:Uncharacterized protein n=1 Tax=Rhizobium mayense TaxID=1312184 RepID=A0ABT7K1I0_9HYPH|nr:hypothetical protein [Rhizobium mayense]MDL2401288.1 hypothetical protein [Rhizobium mayense]